jgi:putative hydrolase of the HAD superfamily
MTVRHIMFDADGVLQVTAGGWRASAEPFLGQHADAFLQEALDREAGWMVGRPDRLGWLEDSLLRFGAAASAHEVYDAVWLNIAVIPGSIELVRQARAAGYGVHLGTNQDEQRGTYMRETLQYDALFDVSCYSCELGVAKPDTAFFVEATQRIGAPPGDIVFVDDSEVNVLGARTAGLAAIRWTVDDGHCALLTHLARQGVVIGP